MLRPTHSLWLVGLRFRTLSRSAIYRSILQAFPTVHAFSPTLPSPTCPPSLFLNTTSLTRDEPSDKKGVVPFLLLQHWQIVLLHNEFIGRDLDPRDEVGVGLKLGLAGSGVEGWPALGCHCCLAINYYRLAFISKQQHNTNKSSKLE